MDEANRQTRLPKCGLQWLCARERKQVTLVRRGIRNSPDVVTSVSKQCQSAHTSLGCTLLVRRERKVRGAAGVCRPLRGVTPRQARRTGWHMHRGVQRPGITHDINRKQSRLYSPSSWEQNVASTPTGVRPCLEACRSSNFSRCRLCNVTGDNRTRTISKLAFSFCADEDVLEKSESFAINAESQMLSLPTNQMFVLYLRRAKDKKKKKNAFRQK